MKLKQCSASNFGSYKELSFDFSNLGLTLIHGATGSGKSTLQDLACWTLFGVTAKNGNADEVRSWVAQDEPTMTTLDIDLPDSSIQITRIRGKSSQNDLYWKETSQDEPQVLRGKDITETQKLLNERLGTNADKYLSSAYFCEFSPPAGFFQAKAKDRRAVFEGIANLEFPSILVKKVSNKQKELKAELTRIDASISWKEGHYAQLKSMASQTEASFREWKRNRREHLISLQAKADNFTELLRTKKADHTQKLDKWQRDRQTKIEKLKLEIASYSEHLGFTQEIKNRLERVRDEKCTECGASKAHLLVQELEGRLVVFNQAELDVKRKTKEIKILEDEVNPYEENPPSTINVYKEQLLEENQKPNPFADVLERTKTEIHDSVEKLEKLRSNSKDLSYKLNAMIQLVDLSYDLRGLLLTSVVKQIKTDTNDYLEKYFDSELRVDFILKDSDSLDVSIYKSGYEAVYTQLSKGQRSVLRLCFVVAIMKASSNQAGIHFDTLFFDEALDGQDEELKLKAFNLFSYLATSHASVIVIEHSREFKGLFNKQYRVSLESDESTIEEKYV